MLDPVRAKRYQKAFDQLYRQGIFHSTIFPTEISDTMKLWQHNEISWKKTIQYVWHHRGDATVNVMLGGVYYYTLIEDQKKKDNITPIQPHIFKKHFPETLDPHIQEDIVRAAHAARRYNGSDRILSNGETEQVVHTKKFLKQLSHILA